MRERLTNYISNGRDQINVDNIDNLYINEQPDGTTIFDEGLKLLECKNYQQAIIKFEKAIEIDPFLLDSYYYLAISLLRGNIPKKVEGKTIKKIEKYLESAINIDSKPAKYYALWAMIKYGYYFMNSVRERPPESYKLFTKSKSIEAKDAQEILQYLPDSSNKYWKRLDEKFGRKSAKKPRKPIKSNKSNNKPILKKKGRIR